MWEIASVVVVTAFVFGMVFGPPYMARRPGRGEPLPPPRPNPPPPAPLPKPRGVVIPAGEPVVWVSDAWSAATESVLARREVTEPWLDELKEAALSRPRSRDAVEVHGEALLTLVADYRRLKELRTEDCALAMAYVHRVLCEAEKAGLADGHRHYHATEAMVAIQQWLSIPWVDKLADAERLERDFEMHDDPPDPLAALDSDPLMALRYVRRCLDEAYDDAGEAGGRVPVFEVTQGLNQLHGYLAQGRWQQAAAAERAAVQDEARLDRIKDDDIPF